MSWEIGNEISRNCKLPVGYLLDNEKKEKKVFHGICSNIKDRWRLRKEKLR